MKATERQKQFKENFLETFQECYDWDTDNINFHFRFKEDKTGVFDYLCEIDIIEDYENHCKICLGIDDCDGVALRRFNNTSATDSLGSGIARTVFPEILTY